LRRILTGETEY